MSTLTPEGQRLVDELAQRHGFSTDAVAHMLTAVIAGQGRMAQFAHTEFGGNGQWMAGGMLMIGDMFNNGLKHRVGALCSDLSNALASSGPLAAPAQSQSQSQGGNSAAHLPDSPFLTPSTSSSWWPQELGSPSSTGAQNSMRYAWFANAQRLVIDRGGDVTVYDTLDHQIGGFSQQQGNSDGISMTSQHGTIDLDALPVVSQSGQATVSSAENPAESNSSDPTSVQPARTATAADELRASTHGATSDEPSATDRRDPMQLIERLGELRDAGLLTDEEFTAKKQELLARL